MASTARTVSTMKRKAEKTIDRVAEKAKGASKKQLEELDAELSGLESTLAGKVSDVRAAIRTATANGIEAAGDGLDLAIRKSRKGVHALEKKWKKMDTKQKVGVIGGLVAVLAAAAATPTLVRKVRAR